MKPWRYNDAARELDDELLTLPKVAAPAPVVEEIDYDGLERIREGDTACRDVDDIKAAADAAAEQLLAEHRQKRASEAELADQGAALDALLNRVIKES